MMNVRDFQKKKEASQKISMVTSYDFWSARLIDRSDVDCILVGDSLSMVIHGQDSTIQATPEVMALHVAAVAKGAREKWIIGDMPFLSFRRGTGPALDCVDQLMKAGAHAVKLEGISGHEEVIDSIVGSGVPVMGHLGLTPQSIHSLGGFRVQGRVHREAQKILDDAKRLEDHGCFALVLECVPSELAKEITQGLSIPTIGIGAGVETDGQVLVLQDLLGLNTGFQPKFLRRYMQGDEAVLASLNHYHEDVRHGRFPSLKESYTDA